MSCSRTTSAAAPNAPAFSALPAWRLSFGEQQRLTRRSVRLLYSSIAAVEPSCVCFWLAMTFAACSVSLPVLLAGLADRLLELDLRVGRLLELQCSFAPR